MRNIFLAILFLAAPAQAQQLPCRATAPRAQVVSELTSTRYGEVAQAMGLSSQGGAPAMLEIFASPETGTWTIVISNAAGMACILAAGQYWEAIQPAKPGKPA